MDFPIFHLDGMGNRLLIAVIGILHVTINHALAVGAMPLVTFFEWRGMRTGDARWDDAAYRMLRFCFIITTTLGALSGVGIWLSVSLVNPAAIASLIRVFFWAWFTEWLVFITEVCLILAYFLLWKRWTGKQKKAHLRLGMALSLFSWITMALIVAILGFMMDPGEWEVGSSLRTAILNPIYLPQLAFRTTLALTEAGLFSWMFARWSMPAGEFRDRVVRLSANWTLVWLAPLFVGAVWYARSVPEEMLANMPVAIGTQRGADWYPALMILTGGCGAGIVASAIYGRMRPAGVPKFVPLAAFVLSLVLMGQFERVREFIRKPYVIGDYMFANGLREKDVPLLQKDGLLKYAAYCSTREIVPQNRLKAGRDVFRLGCSRCHTTGGMNSVTARFEQMFGSGEWDRDRLANYVENMHGARPFMPPFPGNKQELDALIDYVISCRNGGSRLDGDQIVGIRLPTELNDEQRYFAWRNALEDGDTAMRDRQQAVTKLASIKHTEAGKLLTIWFGKLEKSETPRYLELELLEAAKQSGGALATRASRWESSLATQPGPAQFRASLEGGSALRGEALFQSKTCIACHKMSGVGADVGPDLTSIASKRDREYLLESVVAPAVKIAEGYESATVLRDDGIEIQGIIKSRTADSVTLRTATGREVVIPTGEIDDMSDKQTLMPRDIVKSLTAAELRDLVEFLATRK